MSGVKLILAKRENGSRKFDATGRMAASILLNPKKRIVERTPSTLTSFVDDGVETLDQA